MLGTDLHANASEHNRVAHGGSRRGRRVWWIVAFVVAGISLAVWQDVRSRYDFWMTHFLRRGEGAKPYATRLRETTVGIGLALDDIDCFGGSNRGWSSWILRTSARQELVLPRLLEIAANDPRDARRIKALELLWNLTGDPAHAQSLFRIAREAGPPRTYHARAYLQSMVEDEVIRAGLEVPASQPIDISEEQYLAALKQKPRRTGVPDSSPDMP